MPNPISSFFTDPIGGTFKIIDILIFFLIVFVFYKAYKLYKGDPKKGKCGLDPICIIYNWKYLFGMITIDEVDFHWFDKVKNIF